MTKHAVTRRQKDISRVLRERRQAYPEKLKARDKRSIRKFFSQSHEK